MIKGIIQYGSSLVRDDPARNLAFSLHMYVEWKINGNYNIEQKLTEIQSKGLTVMVGEFADQHPEGCNWVQIDAIEIMK